MAFKMKKPTFFNVGNKYNKQNPSAVFQQKKSKEDLLAEGFTPRDADQMIKDGATTGELPKPKGKPSMDEILAEMKLDNQEGFTKKEIANMSEKERIGNLDGYAEGDFTKMKKAAILKLSKSGGMNYGKKMKDTTMQMGHKKMKDTTMQMGHKKPAPKYKKYKK
jgi:hypothetical protein